MSIDYKPNNTFIFSFVRMNPPTPGHLVLIKNLIDKAVELGSEKAYIITSSSVDGKNPMPCSADTIPKPKNKADGLVMDSITSSPDAIYKSQILEEMIAAYKRELMASVASLEESPVAAAEDVALEVPEAEAANYINNEPSMYRLLIDGEMHPNSFYVATEGGEKRYTTLPSESPGWVMGGYSCAHGNDEIAPYQKILLYIMGDLDPIKHQALVERSFDKYKDYAILK